MALLLPHLAKASLLYWDPLGGDSITLGGGGNWDTTTAAWTTVLNSANPPYTVWTNIFPADENDPVVADDARFLQTPGNVTLQAPIAVHLIDFAVSGYSLVGSPSNTITFVGEDAGVALQSGTLTLGMPLLGRAGFRLTDSNPDTDGLTGTVIITNPTNTYSGVTRISAGTLEISSLTNLGLASSIGIGAPAFDQSGFPDTNAYLTLDGGTLRYTGSGGTTNRRFTLTARGGTIESSGTGAGLAFSETTAGVQFPIGDTGPRTLTLGGTNIQLNSIASPIADAAGDGSSPTSVVKTGTGTWVLGVQNSNVYTGSTSILGGKLIANTISSGGAPSSLGQSGDDAKNLVIDGGTLVYNSQVNLQASTDRQFTVGPNGATIESSGVQGLRFTKATGAVALSGSNPSLTLTGTSNGNLMSLQLSDPTTGYALTNNALIRFNAGNPELALQAVTVSGLTGGDTLQALDYRVSSGELYAIGVGSGGASRLYKFAVPAEGATSVAATLVGTLGVNLTTGVGFDFDPTTGDLRVVTKASQQNIRVGANGVVLGTDSNLTYVGPTPVPGVAGIAYSNNVSGAASTTLYGIDSTARSLVTIDGASGLLTTVGLLNSGSSIPVPADNVGFDVASNGIAYASMQEGSGNPYRLYNINLDTGAASLIGNTFFDGGLNAVRDITMVVQGQTSLIKAGPGTWTLDRGSMTQGNTYTGATIIKQGTLALNYETSGNVASAPVVYTDLINRNSPLVMSGGAVTITGKATPSGQPTIHNVQNFNGLTLLPGGSSILPTAGNNGSTMLVDLGTLVSRSTGATVAFGDTSALNVIRLHTGNTAAGILGAWATEGGTDWATIRPGTQEVDPLSSVVNGYTEVALGGTISDGSLTNVRISSGTNGNLVLGATKTTINTLNQSHTTAATVDVSGKTLRLGAIGGILVGTGKQALTIGTSAGSGTLTAGSTDNAAGELILHSNSNNPLTINSVIANNGNGVVTLVNAGTGVTVLNAPNTYTGGTILNGGTLRLGDNRALSTGKVTVNGSATTPIIASTSGVGREFNNDFDLNSDLSFVDGTGTGGLVFRGTFNLMGGSRILNVTQANGYVTLDGTITNGSLVKSGPGALALIDIALPNVKDITLSQGSLDLWSAAGLGNTTIFAANGALSASGAFYAPITSTISLSGNLTLGRPQVSDGIDLGGIIDLTNATPFDPRIITTSGAQPQQVQRISGTIVGGGFAKAGTSELLITSSTSTYRNGTLVAQGTLRLSPAATFGENSYGNDVYVLPDNSQLNGLPAVHNSPSTIPNSFAVLRLSSLSNLGDKQSIYLDNILDTATPFLGWGSAFEANPQAVGFVDRYDTLNVSLFQSGLGYIRLVNESSRPVGIAIDGIRSGVDSVGKVLEGAPFADVWLGATLLNGTYSGQTLTASGAGVWHLGGGGGTLTIAGTNVLTGGNTLVTGSFDQNNRGITGTVYLPNAQNFSGGLFVGAGTTLVTGNNLALGSTGIPITMLGGTLNLRTSGYHFSTDTQYAGRNFDFQTTTPAAGTSVANSTINLDPLGGAQNAKVRVGAFHFENAVTNPTFVLNASNNLSLQVAGAVTLPNVFGTATTAATTTLQVNSGFMYIDGAIGQRTNGAGDFGANLQKTGGGTLILSANSTYKGVTIVNGGTLVLTSPTAVSQSTMRLTSGTLSLRSNAASSEMFNFATPAAPNTPAPAFSMTGSSSIFVGPLGNSGGLASYAGTTIQLPALSTTSTNALTLTVNGMANYDLKLGPGAGAALTMAGPLTLTNNSARVEINGGISGAFNLTKAGIGTLTLSGAHAAASNNNVNTIISQGTIVANHDNGDINQTVDTFGGGTISFTGTSSGALLLAGNRTLSRTLNLDSTGGTQTLGGFGAGTQTFAGDVIMSASSGNTGLTIQSETGSTVNFTGTISGGASGGKVTIGSLTGGVVLPIAGTPALGRGTVVFDPNSPFGNTFSVPLVVANGTLIGKAVANIGNSPFGSDNSITLVDGNLRIDGRNELSITQTLGSLFVTGDAQLIINDTNNFSTQFKVGALKRGGIGTLVYVPLNNTSNELFTVAAGATPINGILAPWIVRATVNGASRDADFVRLDGVGGTSGNLVTANYAPSGNFDAVTLGSIFNVTSGTTIFGNRQVYALRTGSNLNLGNFTLSVGDTTTTGANAFGGIILNNGAGITGGTLDFGQAEGVVYVEDGQTSTIGATITGAVAAETRTGTTSTTSAIITGMASTSRLYPGMTVSGSGVSGTIAEILSDSSIRLTATPTASASGVTLTFTGGATSLNKIGAGTLVLSSANTYRGGTTISRGTLKMGTTNALGRWTNNGAISASVVTVEADGVLDLGTGVNGFDTEIGSLAGDFGAVVNLGDKRLTVGRANLTTVYSGQLLGSSSSVLQKVGTGTLTLDNTRADGYASTFAGSILADQGTIILVIADETNGSPFAVGNSLAGVTTLTLRGGTVSLRASGDNNTTQQNMMGRYDVVVTGGTGTLAADRFGGTDQNKLIELGNLTVGKWQFATTAANNVGVKFNGITTLTDNAYFNTGDVTLSGKVTDNGAGYTLNKVGGNLFLESGLNDYSGGTVITGGNLFFGGRGIDVVRFPGFGNFVPNDTGRAGTGPIVVNPNSVINFTNVGNLAPGQTVRVQSSTLANGNTSAFVIQTDRSVADFNLRTLGRGSLQIGVQNGTYYTPLDMSKIGNGEWGLTTGRSVETLYMGSTLGAGAGNIYRFYGSSGAALVIMEQNAISGTGAVELGRSMLEVGGLPGNANASIRFTLGQDYTGSTLIHRSATAAGPSNALLDIRSTLASGTSASNPIEVYGRLFATGAGTFTNAAGNQVNTNILLRPGSELRLDYNNNAINNTNFLVPTGATSATGFDNKWGDNFPITLDGATLRVSSASSALSTEIIGAVTYKGGAEIFPESLGTGGNAVVLINGALTRVNLGTLAFRSTSSQLGISGEPGTNAGQRIAFQNPANAVASGVYRGVVKGGTANGTVIPMVSPRFYSNTANTFVDYAGVYNGDPFTPSNFQPTTVLGFSDVPFKAVNSTTFNGGGLNNGTEIIDQITTDATTISANTDIWALRTNVEIGSRSTYASTITIRSGGLAVTDAGSVYPSLLFLNGTATDKVEADIWTVSGTVTLRGKVTAQNLVKTGGGTLVLSADNTVSGNVGLTGTLQINGGTLVLGGANPNATVGQPDVLINAAQALGSVTNLRLHAGNFNNGGNQMPQVTFLSDAAATYPQSVTVSEYVPYATLNVDRISTTPGTPVLTIAGGLMIEGGGSDGTVLALTNGNGFDFISSGTTTLGMDANHNSPISVNVVNTDNNAQFTGKVTGPAPLIKTGAGPLSLQYTTSNAQNDYSGGTTINAGTLQLRNASATVATTNVGTGSILLNSGTLQLVSDTANSNLASATTNNLTIAGQSVLTFDRLSSATGLVLGLGGDSATLTTKNSPTILLNTTTGNVSTGFWAGKTVINDSPTFNVSNLNIQLGNASPGDSISGSGHIYKTGGNLLTFNSGAANPFTGGLDVFQGQVRAITASDTFGTGAIRISPAGVLGVASAANLTGGNTQIANFHSSSTALAGIGIRATSGLTIANILTAGAITTGTVDGTPTGTGNGGLLAIDTTLSGGSMNLNTLFDGAWFLGSTSGGTYSGTLTASTAGNVYRLGGGGSNLTLGNATPSMLNGANSVLIGKPNAVGGNGRVTIQLASSTYTGGTTVSRARDFGGGFTVAELFVQTGFFSSTPLGGDGTKVDVFGNLQYEGNNGSAMGVNGNRNVFTFHPGARLILSNATTYTAGNAEGRWADGAPIALRSSGVEILGNSNAADNFNSETIGDLSFAGGSEIRTLRSGSSYAELMIGGTGTLTRVGSGTLTFNHDGGQLGASNRVIVVGGLPMTNGMVAPYMISRADNQFLRYDPDNGGFSVVTAVNTPGNYAASTSSTLVAPTNDGTKILSYDSTSATTLGADLNVWALRTQGSINAPVTGPSSITIQSGGLTVYGTSSPTISADMIFGTAASPAEALIHASSGNLTLNGRITASSITKFGTSSVTINQDQPGVTSLVPWNINQGSLVIQTPGGLGTGPVFLNGWTGNSTQTTTELRLNFNSGSPDELTFTSGKITALDMNLIRAQTANDRTMRIGDIDLVTSNAVPQTGNAGVIRFQVDSSRTLLRTGTLKMADDYIVHVDAGSFGPGTTVGVRPDAINNQGIYNLTKTGDGMLVLGDNSSSFTGSGKTFTVNEGSVKVTSHGSLGANGTTAIIDNGGAIEIAIPNYTPSGALIERSGAIERWAVNGARGGSVVDLGQGQNVKGVHLQIAANQTGTQTINLNGGSIMGYMPIDLEEIAINYSLGPNISVSLQSNSMLGQPYPSGTNTTGGSQNHYAYDMGKQNQPNNPADPRIAGALLDIRGRISGQTVGNSYTLTKVGLDQIQLSGNNNSGAGENVNLEIREGTIVLGSSASLPSDRTLTMSSSGTLDLNGFNASTAKLTGNSANANIGNSATTLNSLTVNLPNGSPDQQYDGGLSGNLGLFVNNPAGVKLTLTGALANSGHITAQSGIIDLRAQATGTASFRVNSGGTLLVNNLTGGLQLKPGQVLAGGVGSNAGLVTGATNNNAVTAGPGSTVSPGISLSSPLNDFGSIGKLEITTGNLVLQSGAHLRLEIANLGIQNVDQLLVDNGDIALGGATLDLIVPYASVLKDQVYYFAINGNSGKTTTGTFANLTQGSFFEVGGYQFQISYHADSTLGAGGFNAVSGNDVALLVTVPEPGSLTALAAGLTTVLGLRRFRRRS